MTTCITCTSATKRGITGVHSAHREAMAAQGFLACKHDTSEARSYSPWVHVCARWKATTAAQMAARSDFVRRHQP